MRVLIVSEGKHEESGALQRFAERIIGAEFTPDSEFRLFRDPALHAHVQPGKGSKLTKTALAWVRHAVTKGFTAVILVIDHDGEDARVGAINVAQTNAHESLPRAMTVAIRTFDAWMLADEQALTEILGSTIQKQPDPEENRDPKARCTELRDGSPCGISLRELYRRIAEAADIETTEKRCPRGFGPFADRVRALRGVGETVGQ